MQEKNWHMSGLIGAATAKRELNDLCRELISREIETGRLRRPSSLRRLRRWVAKQVVQRVGLRGENLRMRWRQAALAAILMSGLVLYSGTEAKAAISFEEQVLSPAINAGFNSKPAFADIDRDGDLDVFIGDFFGNISYFKNMNTAPVFAGTPAISGTGAVGHVLNLASIAATDPDVGETVTLSYQWKANGVNIASATSATYTITMAEASKGITCTITASDGNGGTVSATTAGISVKKPGDIVDPIGVVDTADALRALRIAAGIISTTPAYLESLDVAPLVNNVPNPDGKIDLGDVVVILRKAAGLW